MKIFSIFDSKAEAFNTPFFSQSTGTAIRSFAQAANDEEHEFSIHGGDYTLFELGSFDQVTGRLTQLDTHLNLGLALTFVTTTPTLSPLQSVSSQSS